jgi:hypothetical protein
MAELSDLDWTPAQLRVHFDRILAERDHRYASERQADQEAVRVAHDNAKKAIETAAEEAKERLAAHNGLIDKMEKQADTFVPREVAEARFHHLDQWQARMTGAILVLGAIGFGNLVKLWLS